MQLAPLQVHHRTPYNCRLKDVHGVATMRYKYSHCPHNVRIQTTITISHILPKKTTRACVNGRANTLPVAMAVAMVSPGTINIVTEVFVARLAPYCTPY